MSRAVVRRMAAFRHEGPEGLWSSGIGLAAGGIGLVAGLLLVLQVGSTVPLAVVGTLGLWIFGADKAVVWWYDRRRQARGETDIRNQPPSLTFFSDPAHVPQKLILIVSLLTGGAGLVAGLRVDDIYTDPQVGAGPYLLSCAATGLPLLVTPIKIRRLEARSGRALKGIIWLAFLSLSAYMVDFDFSGNGGLYLCALTTGLCLGAAAALALQMAGLLDVQTSRADGGILGIPGGPQHSTRARASGVLD